MGIEWPFFRDHQNVKDRIWQQDNETDYLLICPKCGNSNTITFDTKSLGSPNMLVLSVKTVITL